MSREDERHNLHLPKPVGMPVTNDKHPMATKGMSDSYAGAHRMTESKFQERAKHSIKREMNSDGE